MDAARIEAVEADIDRFIGRRATQTEVNAEEMMWKDSVRKYRARHREDRLRERLRYHEAMLESHTRNFEEILRRHRVGLKLCEEALGIDTDRKETA